MPFAQVLIMWTLPYSFPQKVGVIIYGVMVGVLMVPLTGFGCLLLGFCVGVVEHYAGARGEGAWILVGSLWLGFYLGIPVGLLVGWKVTRSRLREAKPERLS